MYIAKTVIRQVEYTGRSQSLLVHISFSWLYIYSNSLMTTSNVDMSICKVTYFVICNQISSFQPVHSVGFYTCKTYLQFTVHLPVLYNQSVSTEI